MGELIIYDRIKNHLFDDGAISLDFSAPGDTIKDAICKFCFSWNIVFR